ncbi:tripartite tricarboxylate transporter TctB family protein [Trueperella sp. LYQ143]|uniref:tripartite tricarboxylate transporter TctB family protein n=1 Tax=unclassified Trueperella TaxID=2630174 RepID=UPI003983954C
MSTTTSDNSVVDDRSDRPAPTRKFDVGEWVVKCVFLGVGIAVLIAGLGYGLQDKNGLVGPGLMPFAAGLVTVVASMWDMARSLRAPVAAVASEEPTAATTDGFWAKYANVIKVFLALFLTLVLCRFIGLLLSLCLMVAGLIVLVEKRPWWQGVIAGVIAFLFGYGVFVLVLDVPLPTGMLDLV